MNNKVKYILAVLFDNIGSSLTAFILPLFILDLTGSSIHLSMIAMFNSIPFLILGLPFGALIDKMNLKKVLNYSDAIRAISYFILFLVFLYSINTGIFIMNKTFLVVLIYIVTIITSCVNVFNSIAETTFIPEIVKEDEFSQMNSVIFGMQYLAGLIIPFMGGYIYSFSIVPYVFLINSLTFVISAGLIYKIKYSYTKKKERIILSKKVLSVFIDLKDGVKYVAEINELKITLVIVAFYNFITSNFENDMIVLFKIDEGYSSTAIGRLLMVSALGALLGSFICTKLSAKLSFKVLLLINLVLHVLFKIIFIVFNVEFSYAISIFMIYLLSSILNILIITNRQKIVDKKFLGRANSIYKTVLIGSNSLGFIYGGTLSNIINVNKSIMISTIFLFVLVIISFPIVLRKFK